MELFDPAGQLLGHFNGANGIWWEQYVQFDGRLRWYYTQATNVSRYFHVNALGSLGLATDQTGAPVEEMLHYPFGAEWLNTAGFGWDEKFARFPQHDTDLALYMTAFRQYSPGLGRWLTPDKLAGDVSNPQSLPDFAGIFDNRYAYALNDPVSNIDPSGLKTCSNSDDAATVDPLHPYTCVDVVASPPPPLSVGLMPGLGLVLPGSGSSSGSGSGTLVAQSPLSVRQKGQTFTQCMQQNSNNYSTGGAGELLFDKLSGRSTSATSKPIVNIFTGNAVSGLLFGTPEDQANSAAALTPHTVDTAMGATYTWGRRTTDIFDLNLLGKGGVPQALSSGTRGIKSFLGELDNALSLGMEFTTRLAVDSTLTVDEAIGCQEHSTSSLMVF